MSKAPSASKRGPVRIPITNTFAIGPYSAAVRIGAQQAVANLLLDTGSSAFAVRRGAYDPGVDAALTATPLAQAIGYAEGGWVGPVVKTAVAIGAAPTWLTVPDAELAVAIAQTPGTFWNADGILGLAYGGLDFGYDLTAPLRAQHIERPLTWPWPGAIGAGVEDATAWLKQEGRVAPVAPFFMRLVQTSGVANRFAFLSRRSAPDTADAAANAGWFVVGGGEEQNDLYQGGFLDVAVVHDLFYNVDLKAIRVGTGAGLPAPPLPPSMAAVGSNCAVDTGAPKIYLAPPLMDQVLAALPASLAQCAKAAAAGEAAGQAFPAAGINLADWPTLTFVLAAAGGGEAMLACSPRTYWQFDVGALGAASFRLTPSPQPASVLGLPLLNNYYAVFDRGFGGNGRIRFAAQAGAP